MNLLNFISQYPDEDSCKLKLKAIRDKEGVKCSHCGSKDHYWKKDKWQYECKSCKTRTTLKSGTIMHGSQLPFRYWFIAMHLLTSTKKSFSALELQRQLGHKYYEPIWGMLHKLRLAMGRRDDQYKLSGQIELDEGFFSTPVSSENKDKEAEDVLQKISSLTLAKPTIILLTEKGREYDSHEFSKWFFKLLDEKSAPLFFVIAGAEGPGKLLFDEAFQKLSLSKLTFPHRIARLLLVEQFYRAQTINMGHPYHK